MKTTHLPFLLLSLLPMTGCSDDESSRIDLIPDKTYTASDLELYYNGSVMPGKTVKFTQDGTKATLSAFSKFDLSQISGMGLTGELPSPGIIPGSPVTDISTELHNNGDSWEFTGNDVNDYCTYNYKGYVSPRKMKLYISDAKLKDGGITPTVWKPAPIRKNSDGTYKSLPFYTKWEYDPIPGIDLDLSPFISALGVIPIIPVYHDTAYMSICEALEEVITGVAFLPDGNILLSYVSSLGGAYHLAQTYPNSYQYVIASPGILKLYLNPLSFLSFIMVNTSGSTPESEVDLNANGLWGINQDKTDSGSPTPTSSLKEILDKPIVRKIMKQIVPKIIPMVADGIPLAYSVSDDGMQVYIDTRMAVDIITSVVTTLLEDDEAVERIKQYMAADPNLSPLLPDIEKIITILPQYIERTTIFNMGLNFVPYSSPTI